MSDISSVGGPKALPLRKAINPAEQDQKMHEVAADYEQHFLRELVKSMRTTVPKSDLIQESQTEKYFSEQIDEQNVKAWSQKGGVGLADIIYRQLIEKYGEGLGIKAREARPTGPLPVNTPQAPLPVNATTTKSWKG
jgi:peptidoglycan hydrolase FlgJ